MLFFKNTSAAYIMAESKVDYILSREDMIVNGQSLFRVINFNLGKYK